jgi:Protein of unknown function (DUF3119)
VQFSTLFSQLLEMTDDTMDGMVCYETQISPIPILPTTLPRSITAYMADGSPSLIGIFGGGFHILFATLLWVQTARVRCVFEKDGFEFYNVKGPGLDYENGKADLVKKPDNYVAGTRNRWKYDTIINYGFFPSEDFPVICYFKETETPEWKWNRWFAAFDSYGRGQPHFFPGICNVKKFKEQMEMRGVKRKPIPTLKSTAEAKAAQKK